MSLYLIAIGLIFAIMVAGIGVDRLYRAFAAKNPRLGPFRSPDQGCGSCSGGSGCAPSPTTPATKPVVRHRPLP